MDYNLFHPPNESQSDLRLQSRLDYLRRIGCNQRIAWSKLGCIAIINQAGTGVETRHLACNPKDGKWELTNAYTIPHVPQLHQNQQLQHVAWSNYGAELVVVDVYGRVSFYSVHLAINQLLPVSHHTLNTESEQDALVGFWWLPADRPFALNNVVRQHDNTYSYQSPAFKATGPFHPVMGKGAAIGITKNGVAKLYFAADATNRYQEAHVELETIGIMDDQFTHAAVSHSTGDYALIAAYTISKQIRVYQLWINWNLPGPQNKQAPIYPANPVVTVRRVKIIPSVRPPNPPLSSQESRLVHLEVFGPSPAGQTVRLNPMIACVFAGKTENQEHYSIISRWDLQTTPHALHPNFEQLHVRRGSIASPGLIEYDLTRLDDLQVEKSCIGIWPVTSGTVIALAFGDGSVEFRERGTMALLDPNGQEGKISNMVQAGFSFTPTEPCIAMVLSPNNTVAARLVQDSEIHIAITDFTGPGTMKDPENRERACVALACLHGYSCSNYLSNDDLLMVARRYNNREFNNLLLAEIHRALQLKMDFTGESPNERLIRNSMLQRCLSMQNALDFRGTHQTKTLSGKLAWTTLHLRIASLASGVTWGPSHNARLRQPGAPAPPVEETFKPEAIQSLLGLVKWFADIMCLIISDLLELSEATRGRWNDLPFIRQKMLESNSPALFLALSSAPRAFLRYTCRTLKGLESQAMRFEATNPSLSPDDDAKITVSSFRAPLSASAIKIPHFERVMTDIDGTVRAAYNSISEAERATAERLLFVNNELPEIFKDPVARLLGITIPELKASINISTLYWHDVSWLGLHDDRTSLLWQKTHTVDAVRKIEIPRTALRLRRCTRCCALSDEVVIMPGGRGQAVAGQWVASTQRMCLCGTLWMQVYPYQMARGGEASSGGAARGAENHNVNAAAAVGGTPRTTVVA